MPRAFLPPPLCKRIMQSANVAVLEAPLLPPLCCLGPSRPLAASRRCNCCCPARQGCSPPSQRRQNRSARALDSFPRQPLRAPSTGCWRRRQSWHQPRIRMDASLCTLPQGSTRPRGYDSCWHGHLARQQLWTAGGRRPCTPPHPAARSCPCRQPERSGRSLTQPPPQPDVTTSAAPPLWSCCCSAAADATMALRRPGSWVCVTRKPPLRCCAPPVDRTTTHPDRLHRRVHSAFTHRVGPAISPAALTFPSASPKYSCLLDTTTLALSCCVYLRFLHLRESRLAGSKAFQKASR